MTPQGNDQQPTEEVAEMRRHFEQLHDDEAWAYRIPDFFSIKKKSAANDLSPKKGSRSKWLSWIIGLLMLLAALGCGVSRSAEDDITVPDMPTSDYPDIEGIGFAWPDTIPADIPVLEGDISLVMEVPDSHVRIFYRNLTKRQLEQYLKTLEKEGFELEYAVYSREEFPDNADERIKRGEFDAVDINKGQYHMRLEYGSDTTTYDIYTSYQDGTP